MVEKGSVVGGERAERFVVAGEVVRCWMDGNLIEDCRAAWRR